MSKKPLECTIYKNVYDFQNPYKTKVYDALMRIKNGKSKITIDKLRSEPDEKKQDAIKKSLPCLVFSGVFKARRDDSVVEYSNLIVLDFDHIKDVSEKKKQLSEHPSMLAVWVSPRGNGVKALVVVESGKDHLKHFLALQKEFPDVDPSGKNISRACFESYDPDIYINAKAEVYKKKFQEVEVKREVKEVIEDDYQVYEMLKTWLNNKSEAFVSGNRNNYIYKLASACCRYGLNDVSVKDYLLRDFATSEFSHTEIDNSIKSAYRSNEFDVAKFEKSKLVSTTTLEEVEVKDLEDGFEEFSHVIFGQDVANQADKIYKDGYEKLYGINAPIFDYYFKLKRQEITLMSGFGNMGKSTKMLWILLNRAVLYNEKFAIYSPESVPAEEFYLELVEMLAGCDCSAHNPDKPSFELFHKYYNFVSEHFFFVYPEKVMPTIQAIKGTFLELIIKFGVDGVVIDPFNQVHHDRVGNAREDHYLESVLADLTKFAQQNDVYFFIVAHPKGSSIQLDGKDFVEPTMYDVSGGAMWANKMHNVLIYHRPYSRSLPTDPTYQLKTEKIKKKKIVGKTGGFQAHYIMDKRRFILPFFDMKTQAINYEITYDPLKSNIQKMGLFGDKEKEPDAVSSFRMENIDVKDFSDEELGF